MHWLDFVDLLGMAAIGTMYVWNWLVALVAVLLLLPLGGSATSRPGVGLLTKLPTLYLLAGLSAWLVHDASGWRFSWAYGVIAGISVTLASIASVANQTRNLRQEYLQTGDPANLRADAYSGFIPFIVMGLFILGCVWRGFVDNPVIRTVHGVHKWALDVPVVGFGLGILVVLFFCGQVIQGVIMSFVLAAELRGHEE